MKGEGIRMNMRKNKMNQTPQEKPIQNWQKIGTDICWMLLRNPHLGRNRLSCCFNRRISVLNKPDTLLKLAFPANMWECPRDGTSGTSGTPQKTSWFRHVRSCVCLMFPVKSWSLALSLPSRSIPGHVHDRQPSDPVRIPSSNMHVSLRWLRITKSNILTIYIVPQFTRKMFHSCMENYSLKPVTVPRAFHG